MLYDDCQFVRRMHCYFSALIFLNVSTNTGNMQAFNSLQVKFMPEALKPPMDCLAGFLKGGEIFIPKIPSIKIIDLAKAIAPNLSIKNIGIRSGEKINETMFSSDESINIIEHKNHYIIEPNKDQLWYKSHLSKNYKRANKDFTYKSDTNKYFLSVSQIRKLLKKIK